MAGRCIGAGLVEVGKEGEVHASADQGRSGAVDPGVRADSAVCLLCPQIGGNPVDERFGACMLARTESLCCASSCASENSDMAIGSDSS